VLVSGRISARSARRYTWIRWLLRATLEEIDAFAMQTDADAARIIALGAPAARVQVLGNLKFARQASAPALRSICPAMPARMPTPSTT